MSGKVGRFGRMESLSWVILGFYFGNGNNFSCGEPTLDFQTMYEST